MIIYGWGTANLENVHSETAICPNCGETDCITFAFHSNHAHIFWIPLFPYKKGGIAVCEKCEHAFEKKDMTLELKQEYTALKKEAKRPFWQYIGVGLVVIGLAVSGVMGIYNKQEYKSMVETPIEGDVYEYEVEDGTFSTMLVLGEQEDSTYVMLNEYVVDRKSGMDQLLGPENYSDTSIYAFAKADLLSMIEEKTIFKVLREE